MHSMTTHFLRTYRDSITVFNSHVIFHFIFDTFANRIKTNNSALQTRTNILSSIISNFSI